MMSDIDPENLANQPWYVIYTKARHEKKVVKEIIEEGYEAYCPLKFNKVKGRDRYNYSETPLFGSYCFVRLSEHERRKILDLPSVINYVYHCGKPATISNEELSQIRDWLETYNHKNIKVRNFSANDKVLLAKGPFVNKSALIVKRNRGNYVLLLDGLGIKLIVKIEEDILEEFNENSKNADKLIPLPL